MGPEGLPGPTLSLFYEGMKAQTKVVNKTELGQELRSPKPFPPDHSVFPLSALPLAMKERQPGLGFFYGAKKKKSLTLTFASICKTFPMKSSIDLGEETPSGAC